MRKGLVLALVLVLVVVVVVVVTGCSSEGNASTDTGPATAQLSGAQLASGADASQQTGVWVSGTGKVSVVPDIAILSLGVEAQASTVAEAQSEAASAMADVMAVLVASGVAEKDMQTRWFNISAVTRWDEDSDRLITVGYRVSNTITAKIRKMRWRKWPAI
jgi:uncharacterized protein YggE